MRISQRRVALHGAIVLVVGLLCGVPYGQAITGGWGDDAVRAWHTAHVGLVVGGVWLLANVGVLAVLELPGRVRALLVLTLIASGYGFTVALVVAAAAGVRGLQPTGPLANWVAFAGNTVAATAAIASLGLTIFGCVRGQAARGPDD